MGRRFGDVEAEARRVGYEVTFGSGGDLRVKVDDKNVKGTLATVTSRCSEEEW
jgi:hypothetical protein